MFATCVHEQGSELPPAANRAAYTPASILHLTRGQRYQVAGIGIYQGVASVLVRDDTGRPNWRPLVAFDLEPQSVPPRWEFTADLRAESTHGWTIRMGYPQLVRGLAHIEALIERDPVALAIFDSESEHDIDE